MYDRKDHRETFYSNPENRFKDDSEPLKKVIEYIKSGVNNTSELSSIFQYGGFVYKMFNTFENKNSRGTITSNQLRKFYSEVLEIYQDVYILTDHTKLNKVKINTRLAMLEPRAYYSNQRKYIPKQLVEFIKDSVKLIIESPNDDTWLERLERFKLVFEALIAYSKMGDKNVEI
ncbi:MAG: type III-A CRISPR-associated protein Csm2 [Thermoplasmata archaeon]